MVVGRVIVGKLWGAEDQSAAHGSDLSSAKTEVNVLCSPSHSAGQTPQKPVRATGHSQQPWIANVFLILRSVGAALNTDKHQPCASPELVHVK